MITLNELERMQDIKQCDLNNLADTKTVKINTELPIEQRLEKYLGDIKNPYCHRYGDYTVIIRHTPDGREALSTLLKKYFINRKNSYPDNF